MSSSVGDFLVGGIAIAGALAIGIGSGGTAGFFAASLFSYGTTRVMNGISKLRNSADDRIQGAKFNVRSTQAALPVIYGIQRVGLKISDTRVVDSTDVTTPNADPTVIFPGVDADDDDVLCRVGAFCLGSEDGSGIQAVDNIRVYQNRENVIQSPGVFDSGPVNVGVVAKFAGHLKYTLADGDDAQTANSTLVDSLGWTSNFNGRGVAYGAFYMLFDQEVWTDGVPQITAEITGNRVYDPRTAAFIGFSASGASSDNSALCVLDYLTSKRYGSAVPYAARDGGSLDFIDEQSFIDAANYCDDLVSIPGATTEKRFRTNAVVSSARITGANLTELLATCRGDLVWQNGKYKLVIRQVTTPETFELTEDNIVGEIQWSRKGASVPNQVEATFPNEIDGDFVANSVVWPLTGDLTFLDEDNGVENRIEVELPHTTSYFQALRTIMVMLREARNDVLANITAHQSAYQLQVGKVVQVTHEGPGWVQEEFIVLQVSLRPEGLVELALQQYNAAAYTLDTLNAQPSTPTTNLPDVTRLGNILSIVDDRFISQGGIAAATGTQTWNRRLRIETGTNVRSLRIEYDFTRPTVGGGSTPFSRDYTVDVLPNTLVTITLEDGASTNQQFFAQDDTGTTIFDSAFAVTITPNDTAAAAGKFGRPVTSQVLDLPDEDDLGIRVDAEIEVPFDSYADSNRDAFFPMDDSNTVLAGQQFTVPSGGRNISTVDFFLRSVGNPSGSIWCEIFDDNAGEPGTGQAVSATIQANTISTSVVKVTFQFSDEALPAGAHWAVLTFLSPTGSDFIDVGVDESTPGGTGDFATADEFENWTVVSTRAAAGFFVNEVGTQQVPARNLTTGAGIKFAWRASDGTAEIRAESTTSTPSAHGLTDHTDIVLTPITGTEGDVLYRNGAQWVNESRLKMGDNGSAGAPTYSWLSDDDSGMYLVSAGTVGIATAGVLRLVIRTTAIESTTIPFRANFGSGITDFSSTGFHGATVISNNLRYDGSGDPFDEANWRYQVAAGGSNQAGSALVWKGNGAEAGIRLEFLTAPTSTGIDATPASLTTRLRLSSTQALFLDGSGTVPGIAFLSDPNTGLYRPTSDAIALVGGGVEHLRVANIDSTHGRISIPTGQFYVEEGTEVTRGTAGAVTLDWDAYNQVSLRNDGNIDTINIDDNSMQNGGSYIVAVRFATGGQASITWSASGILLWMRNGNAPTHPLATVGDRTMVQFLRTEGITVGSFWEAT